MIQVKMFIINIIIIMYNFKNFFGRTYDWVRRFNYIWRYKGYDVTIFFTELKLLFFISHTKTKLNLFLWPDTRKPFLV